MCEYPVYLILNTVTETVYSPVIRLLITGKPDEMNIPQQGLFYLTTGIDIVHIGIQNSFEHHSWVIGRTAELLIQFMERTKVKIVNHSIQNTYRIVRWNIFIYSLWEKDDLIGIVRTKMYLCHITLLMPKDTKSLGNNNASAWESRGVVIKKRGYAF